MSLTFYLDDVLLTNKIDLNPDEDTGIAGLTSAADFGNQGSGGATIDDAGASMEDDVVGWHRFHAIETDATPDRLWTGYLYGRTIRRFDEGTVSRDWDCDLNDIQAVFIWRAITGSDGKRPQETDVARLAWLLGSDYLAGLTVDAGLANMTDNPLVLGASDFRHQFPGDVLRDMAGRTGKQFFNYWDDVGDQIALFYDLADATVFRSTLRISNDPADEDADTVAPIEPEVFRDPSDQYGAIDYQYASGAIYRKRPATIAAMGIQRDFIHSTSNVGKLSTAEDQAAKFLVDHSIETDLVRLQVLVTAAQVNLIQAGSAVHLKLTHEPGYESFVWQRVIQRVVEYEAPSAGGTPARYRLHLEMSLIKRGAPASGSPGVFPHQNPSCDVADVAIVQFQKASAFSAVVGTITGASWSPAPTPGNLLIALWGWLGQNGVAGDMAGWTKIIDNLDMVGVGGAGGTTAAYWKIAGVSEPTTPEVATGTVGGGNIPHSNAYLLEVSGVDAFDSITSEDPEGGPFSQLGVAITPIAGHVAFIIDFIQYNSSLNGPATPIAGSTELVEEDDLSGVGNPVRVIDYRIVASTSGAYNVGSTTPATPPHTALTIAFYCSGSDIPPLAGQWNLNELVGTGDGSTVTFSTDFAFAAGSLKVRYDTVDQTPAILSSDGDAMTFTMAGAPILGQQVFVDYQGI